MGLLNNFLVRYMDKYIKKNDDILMTAIHKVNEGGDIEDIDTIVMDYFYLLKAVHRKGKPHNVVIDKSDHYVVVVDGNSYDFDELIRHNDHKNTNRKLEIEVYTQ